MKWVKSLRAALIVKTSKTNEVIETHPAYGENNLEKTIQVTFVYTTFPRHKKALTRVNV